MPVLFEVISQSGNDDAVVAQQRVPYQGDIEKFKPDVTEGENAGCYNGYRRARDAARRMIGDMRADTSRKDSIKLNTKKAPVRYLITTPPTKNADGSETPGIQWHLIVRPVPGQPPVEPRQKKQPVEGQEAAPKGRRGKKGTAEAPPPVPEQQMATPPPPPPPVMNTPPPPPPPPVVSA